MAGNLLGPKSKYVYSADNGDTYSILTDDSLAIAGFGSTTEAPEVFDPESPPPNYRGRFPRGAKPRKVFCQDANGNRKEVTAFTLDADLYSTVLSKNVTIDTVVFTTTGRKGEKFSF